MARVEHARDELSIHPLWRIVVQLLTPVEVAEQCRLSTKTVLRAIHSGRLRASRLGERAAFRVRPADVEAWIEACVVPPPAIAPESPTPAAALQAATLADIEAGRLVLTPEMGRIRTAPPAPEPRRASSRR
jgi:excisionase family DNA binding protein